MTKPFRCFAAASLLATLCLPCAYAQTPGEWKYTITTDLQSVPEDMRTNFPTVSFKACRSQVEFESGQAFALQTLASSKGRCVSTNFSRAREGQHDLVSYAFRCDEGKTLVGNAKGRAGAKQFSLAMTTTYPTPVSGVSLLRQTMSAQWLGACKALPDADEVKVP